MALQALTADIFAAANFGIYHLQSESSCSLPNLSHLRRCNCVANIVQGGRPEAVRRPLAWRRASPFFCGDFLGHGVVEHRLGQKLLQFGVLVLERP